MDLYDVPRPANSQPKYLNVGRSTEEELEYIAFSERQEDTEEGEESSGRSTVQEEPQRKEEVKKRRGTSKRACCLILLLEFVALVVALAALVMGILSFVGLGNTSSRSGMGAQVLIVESATPCFSNSTTCSNNSATSGGEECAVSYSPAPNSNVCKNLVHALL